MYYYIINPAAGSARIRRVDQDLKNMLGNFSISGKFVKTTGSNDVRKLTELATNQGFTTVVAVGGDGTVKEIINSIAGRNCALGIVPLGKTNELASVLGIKNYREAAPALATRRIISLPAVKTDRQTVLVHSLRTGALTLTGEGVSVLQRLNNFKNAGKFLTQDKREQKLEIDGTLFRGLYDGIRITNGYFEGKSGLKVEMFSELGKTGVIELIKNNDHKNKTTLWGSHVTVNMQSQDETEHFTVLDGEPFHGPIKLDSSIPHFIKVIVGRNRLF